MDKKNLFFELVQEIANAQYPILPISILRLKNFIETNEADEKEIQILKQKMVTSGVLPVILVTLKQNFNTFENGWDSSHKLVEFLVHICITVDPKCFDDINSTMSQVLDTCLQLASRLQKRYIHTVEVLLDVNQSYLEYYNTVIDCISQLLTNFQQLSILTLESVWFLLMLMADDKLTVLKIMALIQMISKTRGGVFGKVSNELGRQILDELVYKILDTSQPEIASSSARSMLEICRNHPPTAKIIFTRYKGLQVFTERWIKEPFMKDFQILLDVGSVEQARIKKTELGVIKIQSWWRSCQSRNQLKQANSAMSQFQKSYRLKKSKEMERTEEIKMENELHFMLQMQRKYNMRKLHMKQLWALQIVPASKVEEYLILEQNKAATTIQSAWKMYRVRRGLNNVKSRKFLVDKVVVIQTAFRRYLRRKQLKLSSRENTLNLSALHSAFYLSDERRQQLQDIILKRRESRKPVDFVSSQHTEELHAKVQSTLSQYIQQHHLQSIRKQNKMMMMMKKIDADADFLTGCPRFIDSTIPDEVIQAYKTSSLPVANKAKQLHLEMLNSGNKPWWQKLNDLT